MGNFISSVSDTATDISNLHDTEKFSWLEGFIYIIIPFGQLAARVIRLNGSLDREWLMFPLFYIPPFSFLPIFLMKYGYVHNGQGAAPLDLGILFPIIALCLSPFFMSILLPLIAIYVPGLLKYIDDSKYVQYLIVFLFVVGMGVIPNLYRRYNACNSVSTGGIRKAITNSLISYGMGELFSMFMRHAPIISLGDKLLSLIPIFGNYTDVMFSCLGYTAAYSLQNMYDHANTNSFCNATVEGTKEEQTLLIVALVVIIYEHVLYPDRKHMVFVIPDIILEKECKRLYEQDDTDESIEADETVEQNEPVEQDDIDESIEADETVEQNEPVEQDDTDEPIESDELIKTNEAAVQNDAVEQNEPVETVAIDEAGEQNEADAIDESNEQNETDEVNESDPTYEANEADASVDGKK